MRIDIRVRIGGESLRTSPLVWKEVERIEEIVREVSVRTLLHQELIEQRLEVLEIK